VAATTEVISAVAHFARAFLISTVALPGDRIGRRADETVSNGFPIPSDPEFTWPPVES
jgi:hypothetical protein